MTPLRDRKRFSSRLLALPAALILTMGAATAVSTTMASAAPGDDSQEGAVTIENVKVTCGDGVATKIDYTVWNRESSEDQPFTFSDYEELLNGSRRAGGPKADLEPGSYNGGDNLNPNEPPSQSGTPGNAPEFTIEIKGANEPGADLISLATETVKNPCEPTDEPEAAEPKPAAPKVAPRSGM